MAMVWSDIPEELVYMFVERLVCIDDVIRFGAVCKLWRSVSLSEKQKKKAYAPLMMIATAENDNLPSDMINDGEQGARSFVIPYQVEDIDGGGNKKMRSFDVELPTAQGRRCWGSPYGWVVTVGLDFDIGLLNPFTGEQLPLPPQPILQHQSVFGKRRSIKLHLDHHIVSLFTRKMALGWHQSSQSWLVMTIFGTVEELAFTFTGNGNKAWTCIESTIHAEDVILFQGRIYLIAYGGELKVYDLKEGNPPKAIHVAWPPQHPRRATDTLYLVEIGGDLHFVARYFDPVEKQKKHLHVTDDFMVWRFNFSNKNWYKLDDLGEYALFLGNNTSYAISTITYPDFTRNCIYFTDDRYFIYNDQFCDIGVFDYKEKTVKPFDIANMGAFSEFSRPTFFMPTL